MILADTSAMIDYFRPSGRQAVRRRVAEAIAADRVAINGIIRVELLAFAPNETELARLRRDSGVLHQISSSRPRPCDLARPCSMSIITLMRLPATQS